jgi:hypothetical protein
MGELLFTIGYGGSLIVIGLFTRAFLRKTEQQDAVNQQEMKLSDTNEEVNMKSFNGKAEV